MQQAVQTRAPVHLWIVGILSLLWNCFGAYDYLMTRLRNMDYLSSMPGVDANAMLAWVDSFPLYAQFGWGLGVWMGLLGSILLLMRSRWAVVSFALSFVGILLGLGYQILVSPAPGAANEGMLGLIPYAVIVIGALLLYYAQRQRTAGRLR